MLPYPRLDTEADYRERFTDTDFWKPYVHAICLRHDLNPQDLRPGLWGTNPVYLAGAPGARVVIKLFTHLFGGRISAPLESATYQLLSSVTDMPVPRVLASGELFPEHPDWPWPYLVVSWIPGLSLGEVRDRVTQADLISIARALGPIVRRIHDLPTQGALMQKSRQAFLPYLRTKRASCIERHRERKVLSPTLIGQLDAYLPDVDHIDLLLDQTGLCLGHNDLNHDHVLGEFDAAGQWCMRGVIDFGDARVCDRLYDLTVIHCGLFLGDKELLTAFLNAYDVDEGMRERFVYRAMCYTLLHRYHLLETVGTIPLHDRSLDALADRLWQI